MLFEKHDNAVDVVLRFFRKVNPPRFKLVGVFNFPILVHAEIIAYFLYQRQGDEIHFNRGEPLLSLLFFVAEESLLSLLFFVAKNPPLGIRGGRTQ